MRAASLAVVLVLLPAGANADGITAWQLRLRSVPPGSITIDGDLAEWRGAPSTALQSAERVQSGRQAWSGPADASANFVLLDDGAHLLVGIRVRDNRFVRTGRYGPHEDQVVLWLAFSGGAVHELHLLAGAPGVSARIRRDGLDLPGAQAVEMPRADGWSAEFAVPWSTLSESRRGRAGMRAAVALLDCDSEAHPRVETVLASARVGSTASSIPPLHIAADEALLNAFRRDRGLTGVTPSFDRTADVAGDGGLERIVVVEDTIGVFGPGIRGGRAYLYRRLPVRAPRDVLGLWVRDVTGDRKAEIVTRYREVSGSGEREVFAVFTVREQEVSELTLVEAGKRVGDRAITNRVRLVGQGSIEQDDARATGFDEETFQERAATDAVPVLLPWGPIARRTLRYDGQRFAVAEEERRAATASSRIPSRASQPQVVQAPADPHQAFLDDHGLGGARARFDLRGDIADDVRPERLVAVDRFLVVTGPGFLGGARYFFHELSVVSGADIIDVRMMDLTPDRKQDVVLTARQLRPDHTRLVLHVLRFVNGRFERVFSQEVARTDAGRRRVDCSVDFIGRSGAREIRVRTGRAIGWDRSSYRFATETAPPEPILLPWSGPRERRYRWGAETFVLAR